MGEKGISNGYQNSIRQVYTIIIIAPPTNVHLIPVVVLDGVHKRLILCLAQLNVAILLPDNSVWKGRQSCRCGGNTPTRTSVSTVAHALHRLGISTFSYALTGSMTPIVKTSMFLSILVSAQTQYSATLHLHLVRRKMNIKGGCIELDDMTYIEMAMGTKSRDVSSTHRV